MRTAAIIAEAIYAGAGQEPELWLYDRPYVIAIGTCYVGDRPVGHWQ